MNILELAEKTRTCRRFESRPLPEGFLEYLLEVARVCPSGKNSQPMKYILIGDPAMREKVYPHLRWAANLKDWDGPEPEERPTGYVAFILDKTISQDPFLDTGIVAQTMQLAAMEKGIGSCMIASLIREPLTALLELEPHQELKMILALGYPRETRVIVPVPESGSTAYYRDDRGVHYVPKRSSGNLLIRKY